MSRVTSRARHRADVDGNLALRGLSRAAKSGATAVGRPVAIVAVASGLALTAVGTANAGTYTTEGTTTPAAAQTAPPVAAAAQPSAAGTAHTVAAGDTLGGIAARYGVDLTAVLAANGLSLASVIFPGQTITVPAADAAVAAPAATMSAPGPVAPAAPAVQYSAAVAPVTAPSGTTGSGVYLASMQSESESELNTTDSTSGGAAGILLGSAQAQLSAGAVQDCTVLVEKALRAAGFSVGDLGPSQFFQFGTSVSTPAAGDIVITGGHVAIFVGNGMVISSGMNGINATMEHPLSDLPGASFVRVG